MGNIHFSRYMKKFIKHSLPVIIFFIIGDFITTLIAIKLGYIEKNPLLYRIVENPILFLLVKTSILPIFFYLYKTSSPFLRKVYAAIPTSVGIYLCLNNMYFIFSSMFQSSF